MTGPIIVASIVFLGAFTQSLAGFGVALVTMAILPGLIGIQTAAPLVALVAITLETLLLIRYRQVFSLRPILPLIIPALIAIPLGISILSRVDEVLVLRILGLVIAGYALYALAGIRLPKLEHPAWAYLTGSLSGLLGGAYNTSGPPVIIYGNCRAWAPANFKTNLQGFFLFTDIFIVANHLLRSNITRPVQEYYFWSIPAILLGVLAGSSMDRWVKPGNFQKIVLILLIFLGLRLIIA